MFAPENWTIADSIPPDQKSVLYIDALEDSIVLVFEKTGVLDFVEDQALINRFVALQKRIMLLIGASAIERYHDFVETYPSIVQRVPQRMIASFIGVTPEALSKAKSDYRNKTKKS